MRRQKIRKAITLITFLLFPIIMNYLSPYLIVVGASEGIINGSFVFFIFLFFISMFLGRGFCGWICPTIGLQEACFGVNNKAVGGKANMIKYFIWFLWLTAIIGLGFAAGGFKTINLLYMTESGISVDSPVKYVIYYGVIGIFLLLAFLVGKRAACHSICWMAPFMIFGSKLSKLIKLPSLHLKVVEDKCTHCRQCDKKCPMSLAVHEMVQRGAINSIECVVCGECADVCPKKVIGYSFGQNKGALKKRKMQEEIV